MKKCKCVETTDEEIYAMTGYIFGMGKQWDQDMHEYILGTGEPEKLKTLEIVPRL